MKADQVVSALEKERGQLLLRVEHINSAIAALVLLEGGKPNSGLDTKVERVDDIVTKKVDTRSRKGTLDIPLGTWTGKLRKRVSPRHKITCQKCGKGHLALRRDAKFCSHQCRSRFHTEGRATGKRKVEGKWWAEDKKCANPKCSEIIRAHWHHGRAKDFHSQYCRSQARYDRNRAAQEARKKARMDKLAAAAQAQVLLKGDPLTPGNL